MASSPIVLLWGEDPFLLRDEALRVLGDVEAREVDAAEWEGAELSDLATPSLFGEPRALHVTDCRKLTKEAQTALTAYLSAPDPDAILVLNCTTAERGKPPAALVKAVKPVGAVREVKLARKELPGWIVERGRRHRTDVSGAAAAALVERLGEEPAALDQAVVQLGAAYPAQTITPDLVSTQFRGLGDQHLWDLCDRAFGKDLPGGIVALRSLLEQRADPLMILGYIASRVRDLLKVRSLPERMPLADLAKAAGLRFDWQARRYRDQAFRFSIAELIAIHGRLVDADRSLKSGADGEIVLASLVGEIAGAPVLVGA
ncbi:MAG: DNA polymerase III subunit delta [Actinomycetota bacterium]